MIAFAAALSAIGQKKLPEARLPLLLAVAALALSAVSRASLPSEIPLWPEGVPGLRPDASPEREEADWFISIHHPSLTVFSPTTTPANGTGVIYAPGGGYAHVSLRGPSSREPIRWLNSLGVTVFLLKYRSAEYGHPAPLQDMLRAIRWVRAHAGDYGLVPDRLGLLGISAGGHLAASAATLYDAAAGKAGDDLATISARPDFTILLFPVITMRAPYAHPASRANLLGAHPPAKLVDLLSAELQVRKTTPPAFLVSSAEDRVVPLENSFLYYQALSRAGVAAELHLFAQGRHGYGLEPESGDTTQWPRLCETWLRQYGWIPPLEAPR